MPNTGKPSQDCNLCRSRRVKCDLTQPACTRCTSYGVVCPGYRKQADLIFRHADVASLKKRTNAKKRYAPPAASSPCRSSPSATSPHSTPPSGLSVSDLCERRSLLLQTRIPAHISDTAQARAAARTIARFRASVAGSTPAGLLGFLPEIFAEHGDRECLLLATDLFSSAFTGLQQRGVRAADGRGPTTTTGSDIPDRLRSEQLQLYGRALRSVNKVLALPAESGLDFAIVSVWLLGHYEVLVNMPGGGENMGPPVKWNVHMHGLVSLLRLRGTRHFSINRGRSIFWTMFSFIQIRCLIDDIPPPPESLSWLAALSKDLSEREQVLHAVAHYVLSLTTVTQRMLALLDQARSDGDPEGNIALAAPSILTDLAAAEDARPAVFVELDDPPPPLTLGARVFADKTSVYWAARMKMHHVAVRFTTCLLRRYPVDLDAQLSVDEQDDRDGAHVPVAATITAVYRSQLQRQRLRSVQIVRVMGQAILDGVAKQHQKQQEQRQPGTGGSHTGYWAEAVRVLWPLTMTSWLPTLKATQREAARAELGRLGEWLGLREIFNRYAVTPYPPSTTEIVGELVLPGDEESVEWD